MPPQHAQHTRSCMCHVAPLTHAIHFSNCQPNHNKHTPPFSTLHGKLSDTAALCTLQVHDAAVHKLKSIYAYTDKECDQGRITNIDT